jgi:hypothetical protein
MERPDPSLRRVLEAPRKDSRKDSAQQIEEADSGNFKRNLASEIAAGNARDLYMPRHSRQFCPCRVL